MYVYFIKFLTHLFNYLYYIDRQMIFWYFFKLLATARNHYIAGYRCINAKTHIYAKSCRQCRTNRTKISMALVLMSSLL